MTRMHRLAAVSTALALLVSFSNTFVTAQQRGTTSRSAHQPPAAQSTGTPIAEDVDARALYDNEELFSQLSSAAQAQLERVFGRKARKGVVPTAGEIPRAENFADKVSFDNVLVNTPGSDTNNDTQSETTCLVAGNNVVVGYNDSGSNNVPGGHFTGWAVSTDGGTTFVDKGVLPNSTAGDAGDPVLARDNVTGAIYMATLSFNTNDNLQLWKSTDGGLTFGAPVNCTPDARAGDSMDKEWITVDNFPGTGQGNIYNFWRNFGGGVNNGGMRFCRSTDGGATFGPIRPWVLIDDASAGGQGAWVCVGPDHAVYCFWLFGSGATLQIRMRKSTNLGVSFAPAVTVTDIDSQGTNGDLNLGGGFRSSTFPQAVVNPVNPNQIYVIFPDKGTTPDKANIYLTTSSDGGTTWSPRVQVNDDGGTTDQFMPTVAINPEGTRLFVGYYSRQLDVNNSMIDTFCRTATLSGATVTFDASQRVTTTSFPVVVGVDPAIVGSYMGDYDQASADSNFFYYTWGDNRDLNHNSTRRNANVRFAKIPVNAAPVNGADTLGVWVDAGATFFLRNSNTPGAADITASFGIPGLIPIRGDWNGDGTDTIGAYDSTTGVFFLRNSNTPGPADVVFGYGAGGTVVPLSGDWDGNGTDTPGLYDPATGNFFLRNSNSAGPADLVFSFGIGGGTVSAVVGDWNGDGTDTIGLYDSATGAFFLRNSNSGGGADLVFTFGAGGALAVSGDWNGDGTDSIGLYLPGSAVFFLKNANSPGGADVAASFGGAGLVPIVGDWDGL